MNAERNVARRQMLKLLPSVEVWGGQEFNEGNSRWFNWRVCEAIGYNRHAWSRRLPI